MSFRHPNSIKLTAALLLVAGCMFWFRWDPLKKPHTGRNVCSSDRSRYVNFKVKRNEMSRLLNHHRQIFGKQNCEHKTLLAKSGKKVDSSVSASGGWCRKASESRSGSHVTDRKLAIKLSFFFIGKSVASFGDGPGEYKKCIEKTKRVIKYDSYDGAPYGPETSGGIVTFLDLTVPQYGLPVYDWIISLEVAEHIPAHFESVYLDNIVRHAREGIVLSWAVPGQGGLSHVNNRPFEYVKRKLRDLGFIHNITASKTLRAAASVQWLKNNINVFDRDRLNRINIDDL